MGRRLTEIDRDLRARLLVAADAAMARALERAGNRVRNRNQALRASLRTVPAMDVARVVGERAVVAAASMGDLFDGAWDDLERQFRRWGGKAQRDALDVVSLFTGFTAPERQALGLRQAASLDEGWAWLKESLSTQAHQQLFAPGLAQVGEVDLVAKHVPAGLIRGGLAHAGGAQGLVTDGRGGAWVTLADGGHRPAGGIATGEDMRDALRDAGAEVEGYRWVYGPGARQASFEPHVLLDGVEFASFEDEALVNGDAFPEFAFFFPGDHAGCQCDFELTMVEAIAP